VTHLIKELGLSIRLACRLAQIARSTYLYEQKINDDQAIISAIEDILSKSNKYGCGMVHLKLRQQGHHINHKRTERIYRELGLQIKSRRRRKNIEDLNCH
jgi:putative transposase